MVVTSAFGKSNHKKQAYCLKVHEMAEKEVQAEKKGEAMSRLQSGNYVFRYMLRDCLRARQVFDRWKDDLTVKLSLLDSKHGRRVAYFFG